MAMTFGPDHLSDIIHNLQAKVLLVLVELVPWSRARLKIGEMIEVPQNRGSGVQ